MYYLMICLRSAYIGLHIERIYFDDISKLLNSFMASIEMQQQYQTNI